MGSQRHMLEQMFAENSRALYKMAEPYPLIRIASEHYRPWIRGLYRKYKKTMPTDEIIDEILSTCENHPLYVQQFFSSPTDSHRKLGSDHGERLTIKDVC
jgi:hypothetical protein